MALAGTNYAEIQHDEIQVLKSIFSEDFHEEDVKLGAWKKTADRAFRVVLRGTLHEHASAITLNVVLPATYPKSPPRLRLQYGDDFRHGSRSEAEKVIRELPQALVGNEMIFDIATALQEVVDRQTKFASENTQTLDEERNAKAEAARQEAERLQTERQAEAQRLADQKAAQDEQDLRKELNQQREARADRRSTFDLETASQLPMMEEVPGGQAFERLSRIKTPTGKTLTTSAVYQKSFYKRDAASKIYIVQPSENAVDEGTTSFLCLKQYSCAKGVTNMNEKLQNLEFRLDQLLRMSEHPNVIQLINYRLQRDRQEAEAANISWSAILLTYFSPKGTLQDHLSLVGTLDNKIAKTWLMQLLEGLHHCHQQGITHGSVCPESILLWEGDVSTTLAKWCNAGYMDLMSQLGALKRSHGQRWLAPESKALQNASLSSLSIDIWDLGICIAKIAFGLDVQETHQSPIILINRTRMSRSFRSVLQAVFDPNPKRRASAWDLLHFDFFRNDEPFDDIESSNVDLSRHRTRRESEALPDASEYSRKFIEEGRLGRGGFGEVFRARNRTDGQLYAIKKIRAASRAALDPVLSETTVLSRLNNPHVVRYYSSWIEEDNTGQQNMSDLTSFLDSESTSFRSLRQEDHGFGQSSRGLDFISSNNIVFGHIDDSDNDDSDSSSTDDSSALREHREQEHQQIERVDGRMDRPRMHILSKHDQSDRSAETEDHSISLYIQMEYCKQETLRNTINGGLQSNVTEIWRLLGQIAQGLAHIHSSSIVHRDLKPENIFIDDAGDIRIGDFGLARPGDFQIPAQRHDSDHHDISLTRNVGTGFYVAPEVRAGSAIKYDEKVDLFSLGVIFVEMNVAFATNMERAETLEPLALKKHALPLQLSKPDKALEHRILVDLLQYEPSKRPSCIELLDQIPMQGEDPASQILRRALRGQDPRLRAETVQYLFENSSQYLDATMDQGQFDLSQRMSFLDGVSAMSKTLTDTDVNAQVKTRLAEIFCWHGALERNDSPVAFPWHPYYPISDVIRFLDKTGALYQLPYDLILPNAILLANTTRPISKTFVFGDVYRPDPRRDEPRIFGEANFEIVGSSAGNASLEEAETIKVLEEIIETFPHLSTAPMCYHVNHSTLLNQIFLFCKIDQAKWYSAKETLSKLNTGDWTWAKVRHELRSPPISLPSVSLDELERFDWREPMEKAINRLRLLLPSSMSIEGVFAHLVELVSHLRRMGVRHTLYICPLSSYNEKFYRGEVLYQCLHDRKKRAVFAAGGRYDQLIRDHQAIPSKARAVRCVGFQMTWSGLCTGLSSYLNAQTKIKNKRRNPRDRADWSVPRCDVVVDCYDPSLLGNVGLHILSELWSSHISAELANGDDSKSSNAFMKNISAKEDHTWTIIVKSSDAVKLRNASRQDEVELRVTEVINHMRGEIRERDRNRTRNLPRTLSQLESLPEKLASIPEIDVKVIMAESRSKKTNRKIVVGEAISRAQAWSHSTLEDPIIAIETKDETFKRIQNTSLDDPESWRRLIQAAPPGDRQYLTQVLDVLKEQRDANAVFLYNFRSKAIMHYTV